MNFQGPTETDSRNMTKYFRLRETLANNLQSKQWQTCNASVLHLGWSSMCFTALVRLIDSQVLRRVLCFFLLPGCSGAWQTSQLQARSGRHHDSCKRPKWFCEGTFICKAPSFAMDEAVQSNDTHLPCCRFQCPAWINLVQSLKSGFVTAMVLPVNTRAPLLAPAYTFWQAKAPKPLPPKQLRTLRGCKLQ